MPWKGEKDPYRIWLSEIILQQTRVEQGWAYYRRFVENYPDILSLAQAPDQEVFKLWEGLGYYSRCRNLLFTARFIADHHKGMFPSSHESILKLKGVGPYTAAAVSSFAFNLPHAVVDGNVYRVLSRLTGNRLPIDSTEGKKWFSDLANELLDKKQPAKYNQAMMDFGAIICKPASPVCKECPYQKECVAFNEGIVDELPVKLKKIKPRKRWFYYVILEHKNRVAIRKRVEKDIWRDLYEFPLVESVKESSRQEIVNALVHNEWVIEQMPNPAFSASFKQQLTHQHISGKFVTLKIESKPKVSNDWIWISKDLISNYPFPGFINQFLKLQSQKF